MRSGGTGGVVDPVVAEVAAMLARLGVLAADPAPGADADRIDRIAAFEQMRGALAAAQQAEMAAFARSQVEAQIVDDRLDPAAIGRGIGDQIGLACRVSPFHGSRRLGIARALHFDLPGVRGLLAAGGSARTPRPRWCPRHATSTPNTAAWSTSRSAPPASSSCRPAGRKRWHAGCRRGRSRRVRGAGPHRAEGPPGRAASAPDTISVLSGLLPVEQGVACLAALRRHTDEVVATGDTRTPRPDHGRHPRRTRHRTSPRH